MIVLLLAAAWLAGVVAASLGPAGVAWELALAPAGAAVGFAFNRRWPLAYASLACGALMLLGVLRYEAERAAADPGGIAAFNGGGEVTLRGRIVAEPEERPRSQRLTVGVDGVFIGDGWVAVPGRVLVTTRLFPRYEYGDTLVLKGKVEEPPVFETFDYRDHLARQGIVSTMAFPGIRREGSGGGNFGTRFLIAVRRPLDEALRRALPEPESALARGILLGQRAAIPREVTEDFNRAGISHLVAISGYNVTLVAAMTVASLAWLIGRRRATITAVIAVVFFVFLVGAAPSVLRAGLMGVAMLGAALVGRPGHALTSIALAAALLTLWQPLAIDDVAFQLSFASTLGLILFSRQITERLEALIALKAPPGIAAALGENLGVTAASTFAVMPVIGLTFGRVSLAALPANVLAVPAFPFILLTSAATAAAGAVWDPAGEALAVFARLPLAYMVLVGGVMAAVPGASLEVRDLGLPGIALVYVAAMALLLAALRRFRPASVPPAPRIAPALGVALLALGVTASLALGTLRGAPDFLSVTVLDVGQGDAILIRTPAGHTVLVDGGPSGAAIAQALGRHLPPGHKRIDLVVLTHAQDDHVTGLVTVLERYDVRLVIESGLPGRTAAYLAWRDLLDSRGVERREAVAGEWVDLGRGVRMEVLAPPGERVRGTADELNDNSVVLRIVHGQVSFLLTGDVAAAGERVLLERGGALASTVLKVAHHGSDSSTTPEFLLTVRPAFAVVSAGRDNSFGHPSPTTLLRLAGVPVYRTDRNGSIRFETDGRGLRIRGERGEAQVVQPRREDAPAR